MYTPAEEMGLSGQRLATRVQEAIDRISPDEMIELIRSIRREAAERHLVYQRDGVDEVIRLLPCPITLRPDQLGYTHYVSQTLLNCMKRLPDLYFSVPEVRDILRVTPVEEEWIKECWTPAHREANPMFSRMDATVDYSTAEWKDSIKFMEPNLTGIGGLHIAPTAMELLADLVVPALLEQDPTIRLQLGEDIRELLLQETANIPVKSFHVLDDKGGLQVQPFNVVMGIAPSHYGVAMLVRASQGSVVNIAQQGGMCAVMVSAKALHTAMYRAQKAASKT